MAPTTAKVQNLTLRQYNIVAAGEDNHRVTVRLKPGYNRVDLEHWAVVKDCSYAKLLKKEKFIDFDSEAVDKAASRADVAKSKSAVGKKGNKTDVEGPLDLAKLKSEMMAEIKAEMAADAEKEAELRVKITAEVRAEIAKETPATKPGATPKVEPKKTPAPKPGT